MKQFYMTLVAMLCGAAAMAQENVLYVEDLTVEQGATVNVPICLKNDAKIVSIAYKFDTLPAGFTVASKKEDLSFNEERLDIETARAAADDDPADPSEAADLYEFSVKKGTVTFTPGITGYRNDADEWVAVCFLGNEGELVYHPLTVAEDCALTGEGEPYTVKLKNISMGDDAYETGNPCTSKTAEFKVTVTPATGIIKINADDPNAPVYNVAGQRVSKAQKGIFIQNGKKVAVK